MLLSDSLFSVLHLHKNMNRGFGRPSGNIRPTPVLLPKRTSGEVFEVEKKLASHIPDLVVFDENCENIPHILQFDAVLLFADVSGFTALTERYTLSSEKGTDALTVTLNNYIGKIVEHILCSGGDILKFAGDAILAAWKVKTRADLTHAISQVVKCSLIIQDQCDQQETDVGVQLRVKIAISAGKTYATFVGNEQSRHFMMSGRTVREVNAAEKYCKAGLVVLSPNAMELSDKDNIITSPLGNRFALVKYLRRTDLKINWEQYIDYPLQSVRQTERQMIRHALDLPVDRQREATIRKYVAAVVQKKLDDNQPLKFLSEMRQCSIVFINLGFDLNENDRQFYKKQCSNMQKAFDIIYNRALEMHGVVNKIFLFDKGCTFLVIFGLPGNKHEQEPAHALQASWNMRQRLHRDLSSVTLASFGVTTGAVFCGVIGHKERHEYTVIGQKVNLAARLMIYYPNMIACDNETFHDSKISQDFFNVLPPKKLKGISSGIVVYKYAVGTRKTAANTYISQPELPIIGRSEEMELVIEELKRVQASQKRDDERIIIFEGEAGYGKTRLVQEIQWRSSSEGFHVVPCSLSINDHGSSFFAIRSLLGLLLYTNTSITRRGLSKERILLDLLGTDQVCLLNEIMEVTFPVTSEVMDMRDTEKVRLCQILIQTLVKILTRDRFILFVLDDAHNIDDQSWEFFSTVCKSSHSLMVLTMRPFAPDKPPHETAKQLIFHHQAMFIKLSSLLNDDIAPLACQLLRVKRIPAILHTCLIHRSHGVPLWCEQILREMQNVGVILIVPLQDRPGHTKGDDSNLVDQRLSDIIVKEPLPTASVSKHHLQVIGDSASVWLLGWKNQCSYSWSVIVLRQNDLLIFHWILETPIPWKQRRRIHTYVQSKSIRKIKLFPTWTKKARPRKVVPVNFSEYEMNVTQPVVKEGPKECVVRPNFDLNKFPVPASIRGMALARLDRLEPFEQLLVKSAAVIGSCTSRKMLKAVVPGFKEEKFRRGIYQLMLSHVFECASKVEYDKYDTNKKTTFQFPGRSFRISCYCNPHVSDLNETGIASRCEQFRFHNSLVQETAYKLWLQDQRKTLHASCAVYLESKVDQILTTGESDADIIKQYQFLNRMMADEHATRSRDSFPPKSGTEVIESTVGLNINPGLSPPSFLTLLTENRSCASNVSAPGRISMDLPERQDDFPEHTATHHIPELLIHRLSLTSAQGSDRITEDSPYQKVNTLSPLELKEIVAPIKAIGQRAKCEHPECKDVCLHDKNSQKRKTESLFTAEYLSLQEVQTNIRQFFVSLRNRQGSGDAWNRTLNLPSTYDKVLNDAEVQAKLLPLKTQMQSSQSSHEIQENLSLLYQQLVHHWRNANHTEKTLIYLLKTAEAKIATMNLSYAVFYLQIAEELVDHLDKGRDIVSNLVEDENEGIEVLIVNKVMKASIQKLMGQAFFQQGDMEKSLSHFLKALKILHCSLPKTMLTIKIATLYEQYQQRLHIKYPERYIGSVSYALGHRYVEQVQCLAYIWQLLNKMKKLGNRKRLSQLVALLQVNRAEESDYDFQELITSYIYMMQLCRIQGNLYKSAMYENKAITRCSELPRDLASSDLFVMGHIHLACCSFRLCHGKLEMAITASYRAYNAANYLADQDLKLITLPLMAQLHLLTGRGRACIESLMYLRQTSKGSSDFGFTSYFLTCFDIILDGGFALEHTTACVEYLENIESMHDGKADVQMFCAKTTLAVWFLRQGDEKGNDWLKLAWESRKAIQYDNYFAVRAFARLCEGYLLLLYFVKTDVFECSEKKRVVRTCKKLLNKLAKFCKLFPVMYARYLHFAAYNHMLTKRNNNAMKLLNKSVEFAESCSNLVDHEWSSHSKINWFTKEACSLQVQGYWLSNCFNMSNWETARKYKAIERSYVFKLPPTK